MNALDWAQEDELSERLAGFLAAQPWFSPSTLGAAPDPLPRARVVEAETLRDGNPALARLVVEMGPDTYQVLVGLRPEDDAAVLRLKDTSVIGQVDTGRGTVTAYEAAADTDLALTLLALTTGGECSADRVRRVGVAKSNTSLVYDDKVIVKLFRRLYPGPNPEIELAMALDRVGFNHVATPIGVWRRGSRDLAIAREFLAGGSEGWSLALASLRDLYARGGSPERAGGDFGTEARRLGETTALLHLALAEAFGVAPGRATEWVGAAAERVARLPREMARDAAALLESLDTLEDQGGAIRVHGDYHLGRVMRTEFGWYVLDLEGDPFRPLTQRRQVLSPLKDVAGMLRSFQYVAAFASQERGPEERVALADLPEAWEQRNRKAFLDGYQGTPGIEDLAPADPAAFGQIVGLFELENAALELEFELAFRPWRSHVPRRALTRLLAARSL